MRLEWVYGLGAISTLVVLVGVDLLLALAEERGVAASYAVVRSLRQGRRRD